MISKPRLAALALLLVLAGAVAWTAWRYLTA